MVFVEPFFGVAPESFDAVDVVVAATERFGVFDARMFAVLFQVLVGLEVVGIEHASFSSGFLDVRKQRFC